MIKLDRFLLNYNGNKYLESKKHLNNYLKDDNYDIIIEPFCGIFGFSRAFFELNKDFNGEIWLNDINTDLIDMLKIIKDKPIQLFEEVDKFLLIYDTDKKVSDFIRSEDTIHKYKPFLKLLFRGFCCNIMEIEKGLIKIKNYKEKLSLYKTFFDKVKFFNMDCNSFLKKIPKNKKCLVFFDPPYMNSDNKEYNITRDSNNKIIDNYNKYYDNTTIYIDIYKYFKKNKNNKNIKCLMVINKLDITNYIFKKFYKDEFTGSYQNSSKINNKKNIKYHCIYDNFI